MKERKLSFLLETSNLFENGNGYTHKSRTRMPTIKESMWGQNYAAVDTNMFLESFHHLLSCLF